MAGESRIDRTESWRHIAIMSWALIGLLLLISFALWLLSRVASAVTPFALALVVVFLLRRPVAALKARGMSRSLAVVVCYLVFFAALIAAGVFVVPPIVAEVRDFAQDFPSYYDSAYNLWLQVEQEYMLVELPDWMKDLAEASRDSVVSWITEASRNIGRGVVAVGTQIASFFVNAFLALALAFFVLRDLPKLKSEMLSLPGPARQQESLKLAGDVTVVLEGYIRGQLMIATIVGVATGFGLWVIGVPYALVIGLIAGLTNLIPYLGPLVGGLIAAISAAFVSPQLVLITIAYIVVIQQMESTFLQPKIMSDQVHIHPVLVILSLLVGATLYGLIGMLVAVPIAAVGKVMFVHYYEKWTESSISAEDGAFFRSPRPRARRSDRTMNDDAQCECAEEADASSEPTSEEELE